MLMQKNVVDICKGFVLSLYLSRWWNIVWKQKYHIQKCSLKYIVEGIIYIYQQLYCGLIRWCTHVVNLHDSAFFGDPQGGIHQSEARQYTSKIKIQYLHNLAVTLCCCKTLLQWDEHGDWRYWWKFWGQPLTFGQFIGQKYKMKFIVWSCTIRVTKSRTLIIGWMCYVNAEDKGIIKFLLQRYRWKRELGRESHNSKGIIIGS
jgi:hypothetical protein